MRKIVYYLFTLVLFANANEINAQLFVKGGSYVYNKGSHIHVKGDVELEANSNLYLRQEGQLTQGGTTVNGQNKGTGTLSVFQEGTVNNYAYNYWCSPVGNVTASSTGNRPFGITMLNVPTNTPTATIGFTPVSITTSSYNGFASTGALTIASFWIYKYSVPSIVYATGWQSVGSATTIDAGQGFSMKGVSGSDPTNVGETVVNNPYSTSPVVASAQRYDFRGKPNDGDIQITVGRDLYTLTGNPYPSAIDLSRFLSLNTMLDGVAYFWQQDKNVNSHNLASYSGGYEMYNGITGFYTAAPMNRYQLDGTPITTLLPPNIAYFRKFCPVGQGFMVKGSSLSSPTTPFSTATMRNDYRVFAKEGDGLSNESQTYFERNAQTTTTDYGFYDDIPNVAGIDYTQISKAPNPHIRINNMLNGGAIRELIIGFMDSATDGIERADTASPNIGDNALPYDVYMVLDTNKEFIHSVTTFDINKRFPIGFRNAGQAAATFKIQVNEFVNFDAAEHVYLFDGDTGLYHEIIDNYYELVLSPGVYNNRFEITFTNSALSNETNISESFIIAQNNSNQQLTISNPNALDVKSVVVYDIVGKSILNKENLGSETSYHFSTAALSEGVYVVKLQTSDNKSLSQKIIVKRKN